MPQLPWADDTKPVVHLDEMWENVRDGKGKAWVEMDEITAGGIQRLSGKGSQLVLLHAGSKNG